jgi:hypothetical protein
MRGEGGEQGQNGSTGLINLAERSKANKSGTEKERTTTYSAIQVKLLISCSFNLKNA